MNGWPLCSASSAPDEADAVLRRVRSLRPDDTLLHAAYLPVAEACVLIARGRSDAAVEQLRRASSYELGMVAALAPRYVRAEARLRAGAADEASREFRAVIEHRGADPFSPLVPLSRLGLARALARTGAVTESRKEYGELLQTWASADPDLPPLRQARVELSALRDK